MMTYKDLPLMTFANKDEFYDWLGEHNDSQQSFWLRYYKKGTGKQGIAHGDAVDVALCWGWIDGLLNKYDEESYVVRYTPRRKKSVWSKINVEKIAKLTAEGLVQPSGLAHVDAAKADGRWDAAYGGQSTIELPKIFTDLLDAEPDAKRFFESLTKTQRYPFAFRLATAVGAEKQEKVAKRLIALLLQKKTF